MWEIFIILGVIAEVIKANEILIIPEIAEYILFGFGGIIFIANMISWISSEKRMLDTEKDRKKITEGK